MDHGNSAPGKVRTNLRPPSLLCVCGDSTQREHVSRTAAALTPKTCAGRQCDLGEEEQVGGRQMDVSGVYDYITTSGVVRWMCSTGRESDLVVE